jgi:dihydroorotase-like cyclic amidohydrolase
MKQEQLVTSEVRLAGPIAAITRKGKDEPLMTVGEAARFLVANFTNAQGGDVYWRIAASALEEAAETDTRYAIVHATKAVISLLETERLTRRPAIHPGPRHSRD